MSSARSVSWFLAALSMPLMIGCGGVSELTKENVSRAETVVLQAQQTMSGSEYGALELQRAREHLAAAKAAVDKGDEQPAAMHAKQAELDAELAVAKAQSAVTRKAADEVHASNKMLSDEAQRAASDLQ